MCSLFLFSRISQFLRRAHSSPAIKAARETTCRSRRFFYPQSLGAFRQPQENQRVLPALPSRAQSIPATTTERRLGIMPPAVRSGQQVGVRRFSLFVRQRFLSRSHLYPSQAQSASGERGLWLPGGRGTPWTPISPSQPLRLQGSSTFPFRKPVRRFCRRAGTTSNRPGAI
jgi:hypothetical protein